MPLLHAKAKHGDFSFCAIQSWRKIRVFALRSHPNRKTSAQVNKPNHLLLHAKAKYGDFSFCAIQFWRKIRVFALRSHPNRKTPAQVNKPSYILLHAKAKGELDKKFRIKPFLKGLWVSKGQSPLLAHQTDAEMCSQLPKDPDSNCSA